MNYDIIFSEQAKKSLKSLPKKDSKRIFETIIKLAANPYPHGYKKLKNRAGYRLRQGNYRIIYEVNKKDVYIMVLYIGHRKSIY